MKRRIFKLAPRILLFLLLGAIVNIAVAWGTAMRLPLPLASGCSLQVASGTTTLLLQRRPGDARVTAHVLSFIPENRFRTVDQETFDRALPHCSHFHDPKWIRDQLKSTTQRGLNAVVIEHTHGWPLLAMTGHMTVAFPNPSSPSVAREGLVEIGPIPRDPNFRRLLPLHLICPGFAINTIFYAAIIWLPFPALGRVRRKRRIKRGLCPGCAYPLGDSTVCTECGKPVPQQRIACGRLRHITL